MKIEVKGRTYSGFTAATADVRIDTLCNSFSFSIGPGPELTIPMNRGDECVVTVDGEPIVKGYIEIINGSGDATSHTIDIIGRDRCSDLVDSTLLPIKDIKTPITLKRIIELVISSIKSDLEVVDLTGVKFEKSEDIIAIERGDGAFDFIEKLARKKQVILTSNSDGDVVIQQAAGRYIDAAIVNEKNGKSNNVISYGFSYDDTQRFNRYESLSNLNVNTLGTTPGILPDKATDQRGFVQDNKIREGRQLVLVSEKAGSSTNMTKRAAWEMNIRKARSRTYHAVIHGYRNQTGEIWTPNTIVRVRDSHAQIDDLMLINAVTYRIDETNGMNVEISLVDKDTYTIEAAEPIKDAKKAEDAFVVVPKNPPKAYLDLLKPKEEE